MTFIYCNLQALPSALNLFTILLVLGTAQLPFLLPLEWRSVVIARGARTMSLA